MILASVIHNRILAVLDSEGSDKYTFDQDTKYAINSAMEILISWFNQAFAEKKLSPESLREITKVKVWQASSFSRVAFSADDVGHEMWSLIAVFPMPSVNKTSLVPQGNGNAISKFRGDVTFIGGTRPAKRLTHEEWTDNEDNAFEPGNTVLTGKKAEYAYLDFADYSSTSAPGGTDKCEITIRPDVSNQLVALAYLKYPNQVATINDSIEFPKSLTELITEIAANQIAVKQGDSTNLWAVSAQNVNRLVALVK